MQEDGEDRLSSRKASMFLLHFLLAFMIITNGYANGWNYPQELWYIVTGGSLGYSGMRVLEKVKTNKPNKDETLPSKDV